MIRASNGRDVGISADRVPLAEFIYGKKVIKHTDGIGAAGAALSIANPGMLSDEDHEYAWHSLQKQVDKFILRIVHSVRQKLEQHSNS